MFLKKLLLAAVVLSFGFSTFAQKSNIRTAKRELEKANEAVNNNNHGAALLSYQKAKTAIDTAVEHPKSKDLADAWLTKASVYINLQGSESFASTNPYKDAYDALQKTFSLDANMSKKEEAVPIIVRTGFYAFNDGVASFNDSKYAPAVEHLAKTINLFGEDGDKRFANQKEVDTIRAQAIMISGYASYYSDNNSKAIELLEKCTNSPYLSSNGTNIYLVLAQAYEKAGNKSKQIATLEAGLKKYPNDENLKSAELNYYIDSGDTETLINKLEEDVKKNANNAQAYYNLGILYDKLAENLDESETSKQAEYYKKAENNLNKAIELNPDNPQIIYQLAAHYYNLAAVINNEMNQMTGENQKKYNSMKSERDNLFGKALPLLERAKTIYRPKSASLSGEDRKLYAQTLSALSQIYTIQDKLEEAQKNRDLMNRL